MPIKKYGRAMLETRPAPRQVSHGGFPHDLEAMTALEGMRRDSSCLIILGGPSGADWKSAIQKFKPDLVFGVNGVLRATSGNLDYWLCMETWDRQTPPVWFQDACRGTRIVNNRRYPWLCNKVGALAARRGCPHECSGVDNWNPRIYGGSLYHKERFHRPELYDANWNQIALGTIAIQALHLAALGASRVRTIGLDLCIRGENDHWYPDPPISRRNIWWDERMFTDHCGLRTMYWWIDSAALLMRVQGRFEKYGCHWTDHSEGLLSAMGMQ
jgi:hypothetical protein